MDDRKPDQFFFGSKMATSNPSDAIEHAAYLYQQRFLSWVTKVGCQLHKSAQAVLQHT